MFIKMIMIMMIMVMIIIMMSMIIIVMMMIMQITIIMIMAMTMTMMLLPGLTYITEEGRHVVEHLLWSFLFCCAVGLMITFMIPGAVQSKVQREYSASFLNHFHFHFWKLQFCQQCIGTFVSIKFQRQHILLLLRYKNKTCKFGANLEKFATESLKK